ncbi:redoxin domain-containing protein [Halarcobacter bivalviorum]|uniref:Copper tolerance-associated protein, TlpA-like family n=1 Tax=Halarcobacter bivalviorum TaxID=663364 RepID=A0AAX2ACK0_9BACT|nr:redoxin domain-containing protein [Halarcobacter bivalviorum]AXH11918.1 putative copper tolerance-associated protein, TlpA-like family [Halarcobacter bivalviorum]RXK11038.1 protein disulfide oxidoreductase [Halarcobacter bivalviorum]
MKDKIKKYFKEFILFALVLFIVSNALSYYRSSDLNKNDFDIKSVKLLDDTIYTIVENKPLIIHFWATWCPTCHLEAANIERISKDYEVITIAVQSGTKEEIESYLQKNKLSFKVVNDENAYHSTKFNISVFPTTLIYDSNKNLKFSEVGYTTTAGLYSRMALIK